MNFELHERLSLTTKVRHVESKLKSLEERVDHRDEVIRQITNLLNIMDKNLKLIARESN
tara:strand:- start:378 stop:554 length:177 start_codon:yes stop_codon:yes gene_type:complete